MKKVIFCLIFMAAPLAMLAQNVSFEYPFKPGDAKWKSYETNQERKAALQIPTIILDELSTQQLLDICLEYPYLLEVTFSTDYQKALEYMAESFNGLKALITREDLLNVLLNKERDFEDELIALSGAKAEERGLFSYQSLVVDVLLCKSLEQSKYPSESLIQEIQEVCEHNETLRSLYPETFGSIHEKPMQDLQLLFDKYGGLRFPPNYQSVTIYTPRWTQVQNAKVLTSGDVSLSTYEITQLSNHLNTAYNGAQLVEANTWRYNTPGWTWYKSENNQDVCIFYKSDTVYVSDHSYVQVPQSLATKVVYGDFYHSATKYDSQWYISKWGDGGPLVKHHLADIPDGTDSFFGTPAPNYHPYSQKRYYMLQPTYTISGSENITSSEVYYVPNLPSGYNVTWSLSDSHYNQYCLQQNSPNPNQCTITKDGYTMTNATLTANIWYQGYAITTATKTVSAATTFYGTYNNGNGNQPINYPNPIWVTPGTTVYISSPYLVNATVTYTGSASPTYNVFYSSTGQLEIGIPSTNYATIIVNIAATDGNTYLLPIIASNTSQQLAVSAANGQLTVSIVPAEDNDATPMTQKTITGLSQWTLEVYNTITAEKKCLVNTRNTSCTIPTLGWKPGIYSVRATIGGAIFYEKILIK